MKPEKKASILKASRDGWVKVITPYDVRFVTDIKYVIPFGEREWNPADKCWLVRDNYLEEIIILLQKYYDEITTDLIEAKNSPADGPYATMFLLPEAPVELVKSAYRLLSMVHHPDHGGTDEQMDRLNNAYEQIRRERNF